MGREFTELEVSTNALAELIRMQYGAFRQAGFSFEQAWELTIMFADHIMPTVASPNSQK